MAECSAYHEAEYCYSTVSISFAGHNELSERASAEQYACKTYEEHAEAAMTVGGCTPAFTYMFIEALADGAVRSGLRRGDAMLWAAQAVAGAAELVIKSGEHPGALKDAVCSPGGATIEGIRTLEMNAFRGGVIDAVTIASRRSAELGKPKKEV